MAFVSGSVAKGTDTASSNVDLLIVSDTIGYADALEILHPAMESLGRVHGSKTGLAALLG